MKKNVLIISYAYPPNNAAGAQRPYAIAKYLNKDKYNVKVITCENPDLPIGENPDFNSSLEGVELLKVRSWVGNLKSKRSQYTVSNKGRTSFVLQLKSFLFKIGQQFIFPDKGMFWYPNVKEYLRQNKELIANSDIVFSTSPGVTNHQIAKYIKKKNKKVSWIADFRDFNYVEHWDHKFGIRAFLHKKLEKSIITKATYLTFVTKTMCMAYKNFYPNYVGKMHYVYNGSETTDISSRDLKFKKDHLLNFFYAGTFYNGLRSPYPLMQLLDKSFQCGILKPEDISIDIAGNFDENMKIEMQKYMSYKCVKFLGNIPRTEVLQHMSNATFLWLIVANIKSHYQTVPIKLFEYISSRRPIINFAPILSEPSFIIKELGIGYNFDTLDFNIDDAYLTFKDLVSHVKAGQYNESLSKDNLESFSWGNQVQLIENILS